MQGRLTPVTLVLSSVVLAVVADLLLCEAAWGLNVGIWAILIATVGITIGGGLPASLSPVRRGFALTAIVFACLFSLRDSDSLKIANGLAISFCLGALLLPKSRRVRDASVGRLLGSPFLAIGTLGSGVGDLASALQEARRRTPEAAQRGQAVLRGLLLALPLLLVFGGLFASADAVFRTGAQRLFRFDLDFDHIASRFWTFGFALAFVGGMMDRLLLAPKFIGPLLTESAEPDVRPGRLGIIEVGIVLGSLALLFGTFLAVQFRYLFGAGRTVDATIGLSYAEYARSGFFELVWVATLSLMVLLSANALLRRVRRIDETLFRLLGRTLVVMVFAIVASALLRMKLYTDAFGLTELRVYSTVFMLWLVLAFIWLLATTLKGRPHRCAFGMLVAGLVTIFLTNLADPDGLIVRTNLAKTKKDFRYLKTLGDDATVALVDSLASLPEKYQDEALKHIDRRKKALRNADWRELNLSRIKLLLWKP